MSALQVYCVTLRIHPGLCTLKVNQCKVLLCQAQDNPQVCLLGKKQVHVLLKERASEMAHLPHKPRDLSLIPQPT